MAGSTVEAWFEEGEAAWPAVALSLAAFQERVGGIDAATVEFGADLFLAAACLDGDTSAIRAFESAYFSEVGKALARTKPGSLQRADVEQALREKLFVDPAKLAQYTGRGPLRMWVRVTVSRMVQNLVVRGPKEDAPLSGALLDDLDAAALEPELQHMKATYREEFQRAFAEAVAALEVRDRVLLHQSFAERQTQAALAESYDVHVNTIARWLRRARTELETQIRTALTHRLKISATQFDSVLNLVRSRLDLSLGPVS